MREHNHHMVQCKELNLPNGETKDETMIKMLALGHQGRSHHGKHMTLINVYPFVITQRTRIVGPKTMAFGLRSSTQWEKRSHTMPS